MDQTSHPASQRFRIQIRHGTFCENIFLYSEKRTNEFPNFSGTVYLLSSPGAMDVSPCGKLSDFGEKIVDQTAGNKQCFQNPSISFKFLGVWELRNGIF